MESFAEDLPWTMHRQIGWRKKRISDTALYELLQRIPPEGWREALWHQLRQDIDAKRITNDLFPQGVLSYDGKHCGYGKGASPRNCRSSFMGKSCKRMWTLPTMRCALTSCSSRPVLDQEVLTHRRGEASSFVGIFERDVQKFHKLFRYVTVDAGITSRENARAVVLAHKHYVFALKSQHHWLYRWVTWLLQSAPLLVEKLERYRGNRVHRAFYRMPAPIGLRYPQLQQLWKIVQTTHMPDGHKTVEERYYLTSIPWCELKPEQMMALIRLHWGIENGSHWTMDVIFDEDTHCPCQTGFGPVNLSWLTLMAFNIVSMLRRTLSKGKKHPEPWQRVIDKLYQWCLGFGVSVLSVENALGND